MEKTVKTNDFCTLLGIPSISYLINRKFLLTNLDTGEEVMCGTILGCNVLHNALLIFISIYSRNIIDVGIANEKLFFTFPGCDDPYPEKGFRMTFIEG